MSFVTGRGLTRYGRHDGLQPFDVDQVERALRRLRIAPLLDGMRGEPALDVAAFC